ncbi:TPA: HIT domain-containing protein [Candidatus Woesearchaeota archaeon]|nr:HIT domain-containing protein [Candidatus Woesearchaeota archaeon]
MNQEQAQELQERLSRMSPEELRDYQKQNCIFCHISSGKQQAKKIYEDINCLGVLDINPANAGHVLLLPKEHYAVLPLVPDEILGHLAMVAKAISNVMLKALEAKGTTIFVANGAAAGQKAQHVMLHIIPRDEKDGLNIAIPKYRINDTQLKQIKDKLAPRIKEVLNYAEKKPESEDKKEGKGTRLLPDQTMGFTGAQDTTIPAMMDIKIRPDEGLLENKRKKLEEIGFVERKEIENKPRVIDVEETPEEENSEEEKEDASNDEKEQESEEEEERVPQTTAHKRKPRKKAHEDENDSSQENDDVTENNDDVANNDKKPEEDDGKEESAEKPKSGVDLDVIAKLFG